jgi:hypothetical protein
MIPEERPIYMSGPAHMTQIRILSMNVIVEAEILLRAT